MYPLLVHGVAPVTNAIAEQICRTTTLPGVPVEILCFSAFLISVQLIPAMLGGWVARWYEFNLFVEHESHADETTIITED